jgi:hypothetical protein
MMMIVSNGWSANWQGKPKYSYLEKSSSATLSTTKPILPDPGSNPSRRGGKLATNRLSYGKAIDMFISIHTNTLILFSVFEVIILVKIRPFPNDPWVKLTVIYISYIRLAGVDGQLHMIRFDRYCPVSIQRTRIQRLICCQ